MKSKFLFITIMIILLNFSEIKSVEPALKINLNPPEENVKDTIEALKDIDKLEDDLRIGLDEDFDDEKKKLISIQKARIHDIVHGAFIALKSLIPNPIKASLRKALKDHLNGKGGESPSIDAAQSIKAVETDATVNKINTLQQNIHNLSKFKEQNVKFYTKGKNNKNNLRMNTQSEESIIDGIVRANVRNVEYIPEHDSKEDFNLNFNNGYNTEIFETNSPIRKPL